jgi:hypothetical protein
MEDIQIGRQQGLPFPPDRTSVTGARSSAPPLLSTSVMPGASEQTRRVKIVNATGWPAWTAIAAG